MITLSPKLGEFLIKLTQSPDVETALRKIIKEYLELKLEELERGIKNLEDKWGLTFEEFASRCRENTLGKDSFSYEVEKDFWEWESLETLRNFYLDLRSQWI